MISHTDLETAAVLIRRAFPSGLPAGYPIIIRLETDAWIEIAAHAAVAGGFVAGPLVYYHGICFESIPTEVKVRS